MSLTEYNQQRLASIERVEKRAPFESIVRQLERLAERLSAPVRPGHCDYISKASAAECATAIARELEGLL